MDPYHFLAALPAVLAFSGFVAYQLIRRTGQGDDITRRIVEKLRSEAPNAISPDQRLNAEQVERVLHEDQNLQRLIGEQDYGLLKQTLKQQFIASLAVYGLVSVLCAFSVFLFIRHESAKKTLALTDLSLTDPDPSANGLAVDLDPLEVKWSASGVGEDIKVYLENIQTGVRTAPIESTSGENITRVSRASYEVLLSNRGKGQANRIRAVIQSREKTFTSAPVEVHVGITVLTVVDSTGSLTVAAMIDNSRIPYYDFEAKILVPSRIPGREPLLIGPNILYQFHTVKVSRPRQLDWSDARGVYFSPDDPRLVRFEWLIDDSVRQ